MNKFNTKPGFLIDEWKVIQNELIHDGDHALISEATFSLGNEYMGGRGNFEESYSGPSHQGFYQGGVWFPDATRVGWWKNGYPKYFGKQINSLDCLPIHINILGKPLDLFVTRPWSFKRTLDMKEGVLYREFTTEVEKVKVMVSTERLISLDDPHLMAIKYCLKVDKKATIEISSVINSDVMNKDSNYGEKFWVPLENGTEAGISWIAAQTRPNPYGVEQFTYVGAQSVSITGVQTNIKISSETSRTIHECKIELSPGEELVLNKYVYIVNSRNATLPQKELPNIKKALLRAESLGYDKIKKAHVKAWNDRWQKADIKISGDPSSQQAIRFSMFHLFSTFYGNDNTLNIGPKGFTGEKYGGATYWDTEAFCLPVYLATANEKVARALLDYRHNQLDGAVHNAQQQGLAGALFPMVTFNGIECHNEWEITFEEIHRNAAIVYGIYSYVQYTGDVNYIDEKGIDVIVQVARFWADRCHFSERAQKYMIHGVTGPNEFENNVNNNFYTNFMARWCLEYAVEHTRRLGNSHKLIKNLELKPEEISRWQKIAKDMHLAVDPKEDVFVQNDGYMDKELIPVSQLQPSDLPLVHNWSWDKILRSCYIKQADVLQAMSFFPHKFTHEEKTRNFDFYEPLTVHESSLSPSIHAILAAEIGKSEKSTEMYLRSSRLDLENINSDTKDGLHITSAGGSWLAIVHGFAQMRHLSGDLSFAPMLPKIWTEYEFNVFYRGSIVSVHVNKDEVVLKRSGGTQKNLPVSVYGKQYELSNDEIPLTIRR